jgi:hypothetical protein
MSTLTIKRVMSSEVELQVLQSTLIDEDQIEVKKL